MKSRHLEIFHSVYTLGTITEAAKALNISQPGVSKLLSEAEKDIGFSLFNRVKKRLIPTEEAHRMYSYADRVLKDLEELQRFTENTFNEVSNTLRISSSPSIGIKVLPEIIAEYSSKKNDVNFDTTTKHSDQMISDLINQKIDIGITTAQNLNLDKNIKQQNIYKGKFLLVTPINFFTGGSVFPINKLNDMPFIKVETSISNVLDEFFLKHKVQPRYVSSTDTYQIAKSLVSKNLGVTILDEVTADTLKDEHVNIFELSSSPDFTIKLLSLVKKEKRSDLINNDFISFVSNKKFWTR